MQFDLSQNQYLNVKDYRPSIIAVGVALLVGFTFNYCFVAFVDIFGFCNSTKLDSGRRLRDQVSRHMYVFGIGCMLSMAPIPGLNGTFHAVLAWLAWLCLMGMHVSYLWPFEDAFGRYRIIATLAFYVICVIWYIGITSYFFKDTKGF